MQGQGVTGSGDGGQGVLFLTPCARSRLAVGGRPGSSGRSVLGSAYFRGLRAFASLRRVSPVATQPWRARVLGGFGGLGGMPAGLGGHARPVGSLRSGEPPASRRSNPPKPPNPPRPLRAATSGCPRCPPSALPLRAQPRNTPPLRAFASSRAGAPPSVQPLRAQASKKGHPAPSPKPQRSSHKRPPRATVCFRLQPTPVHAPSRPPDAAATRFSRPPNAAATRFTWPPDAAAIRFCW